MSNNQEEAADAISEAKKHMRMRQYEQALAACAHALKIDPNAYDAYGIRWSTLNEMMAPDEARAKINAEVEAFLEAEEEKPEVLHVAYWGYMYLPGRTQNVLESLFDRMLQYPGTKAYLSALRGLAERSQDAREKWHYNQRVIDEFTSSNAPILSWYLGAHEDMLRLSEKERSLASDEYLDVLIERCLQTHLAYCRNTEQWFGWAYTEAVKWRIKFGINLDKALETLERAEERLKEKEEQEWLVEHNKGTVEEEQKNITRLRGQIYLQQDRWKEAYDSIEGTAPRYLISLWCRFGEETICHFWMLGRAAEGLGELDKATRYYADAHFAPNPHPEASAGLERVYRNQHGTLEEFDEYLKEAEAEYRKREAQERETIRQNLIEEKIDKEAVDFTFETLDGQTFTLSAMRGKVVLLDVWASWCGPCKMAMPEVEKVYEQFRVADDVVIWGVNSGETPEKVRAFLAEYHLPWPILLDLNREVSKAYEIMGIPCFVIIDKDGHWQYKLGGYHEWAAQELIWYIEALRMAD